MFENPDSDEDGQRPSGAAAHKRRMNVIANARRAETTSIYEEEMETFSRKRRRTSGEKSSESEDDDDDATNNVEQDDNAEEQPPEKKAKMGFAERMMANMGYKEGEGLGKHGQGRTEPVGLSTQRGRVGLGHEASKVVSRTLDERWDEAQEEKPVTEDVLWMKKCNDHDRENAATECQSDSWIEPGAKKTIIDDEIEFCSEEYLTGMLKAKDVFDHLSDRELREARTRANPYETISGAFFQNRAAMKAANLDKVFDWLFSQEDPKKLTEKNPVFKKDGEAAAKPVNTDRDQPLFYFADVCAGPGGFSEYMLWRKGFYNTKGFGFTLAGKDDFKLEKFNASSPYFFEPFYGKHNNGDVMNPENIDSLEDFIMRGTDGQGVHLMMADGGFSVEGQENIQEILSKRLYLCQLLVSLCIVRNGGNFFCKLFDLFTPFSAGLVYLMYVCYDEISLHKPHTSRPANSERYIICKGLRREYSERVKDYLKRVNKKLDKFAEKDSQEDIVSIVPLEVMKEDEGFYAYLVENNERLAHRQEVYLKKYLSYAKNQGQIDRDQGDLREKCMQYWEIPDKPRARKEDAFRYNLNAMNVIGQFCKKTLGDDNLNAKMPLFSIDLLANHAERQLKYAEFACTLLSERVPSQPKLLVSKAKGVFIYDKEWKIFEDTEIRIPERTILLVELSKYHTLVDGKPKEAKDIVRIIDAAVLHGDDVSNLTYCNRMKAAEKFCKALHRVKPEIEVSVPIQRQGRGRGIMERVKRTLRPKDIVVAKTFGPDDLIKYKKNFKHLVNRGAQMIFFEENDHFLAVTGVRFAKILKEGWSIGWSRTQKKNFAFQKNQESVFEEDFEKKGICIPFWDVAIMKRHANGEVKSMQYIWRWESSLNDDYGPSVIFSKASHQSGATLAELQEVVHKNQRNVIEAPHH